MAFKDMLDNMNNDDSYFNSEALEQFKQLLEDPAFDEVIHLVFDTLDKYYHRACMSFTDQQAFELTEMVFARFLETGRLL